MWREHNECSMCDRPAMALYHVEDDCREKHVMRLCEDCADGQNADEIHIGRHPLCWLNVCSKERMWAVNPHRVRTDAPGNHRRAPCAF